MVKIRALQSLASSEYGKLSTGEIGYCKPSTAKQLVEWGMAAIVEENVNPPVKKIKEHIFMKGYEPKQESKPVLYEPEVEEKQEEKDNKKDEPEKAAGKKEYTEAERAEQKKKQYK